VLVAVTARAVAAPYEDDDLGIDRAPLPELERSPIDSPIGWAGDQATSLRGPPSRCDCDDEMLAHAIAAAPPLADVIAAAERAAGVADDPTPGWRRRSRFAALVPWVTVRAGNSDSWRDVVDPTVSHAVALGATLAWRLDRLVYDPNEPRFATLDVARRRERRRIAHATSAAYFAWLEAAAAAATPAVRTSPQARLALMEAVAHLDALTATWFSHTLAKQAGSR
jgi:hypothetical protein